MSNISSFSHKYHIAIAFVNMRLHRNHFAIDQILLLKQGFQHLDLKPQYSFKASETKLWTN